MDPSLDASMAAAEGWRSPGGRRAGPSRVRGRWHSAVRGGGALLAAVLASPVAGQGLAEGATRPGVPLDRSPGSVAVLAVATERWLGVATDPQELLGEYRFLPPYATDDTRGQLFRVVESDAPPGAGGGGGGGEEGSFIAVPWTLGCGCAEEGWGDTLWVEPGDTVVFLLEPTRVEASTDGLPVFDVLGWHQPYPAGEMIPYWRRERAYPEAWLTPREYFELLGALPWRARFRLEPRAAFREVLEWIALEPGREGVFPVRTLLQDWEAVVEGGAGSARPGGVP